MRVPLLLALLAGCAAPPRPPAPERAATSTETTAEPELDRSALRTTYRLAGDPASAEALQRTLDVVRARLGDTSGWEWKAQLLNGNLVVDFRGSGSSKIRHFKSLVSRRGLFEIRELVAGSRFMQDLYHRATSDPRALAEGISAEAESWSGAGTTPRDRFLAARDRVKSFSVADAKARGCFNHNLTVIDGEVECRVTGRMVLERYVEAIPPPPDHRLVYEVTSDDPHRVIVAAARWRIYYAKTTPWVTNDHVADAQPGSYADGVGAVRVTLTERGRSLFGSKTADHLGQRIAIMLDDTALSAPVVASAIPGGRLELQLGAEDRDHLAALATLLRHGALPAELVEESTDYAPRGALP